MLAAMLIAIFIAFDWMNDYENPVYYYQDYRDMINQFQQANPKYESGWIEKTVPTSATNIHRASNIDSTAVWIAFKSNPSVMQSILANGKEITGAEKEKLPYQKPAKEVDWWFANIDDVSVYKVDNIQTRPVYIAVSGNFFYLWREGG